ncbi:MAG: hypothetical protein ACREI2_06240, partial [Nitrospiraceae bacterium]
MKTSMLVLWLLLTAVGLLSEASAAVLPSDDVREQAACMSRSFSQLGLADQPSRGGSAPVVRNIVLIQITRYTYDTAGRMLTITDARGITFLTNEYDTSGRVIRQTQADSGIWQFAYTTTTGIVTQTTVTDPRGKVTTTRFNGQRYVLSQADALGQATVTIRGAASNLALNTTDPLGRKTTFEYDTAGNITKITDPDNKVMRFEYDAVFNRVT